MAAACATALAVAASAGCSGSGGTGDGARNGDGADGTQSASAAPPGRYRVLPEPCGSVAAKTLEKLVPDADDSAGEAVVTFDTDRKAGCAWTGHTDLGNRYLHVDLERVVSYDATVSDESQAAADYDSLAAAAHIPAPTAPADAGASVSATTGPTGPTGPESGDPVPPGTASPSTTTGGDTSPRTLDDLGDGAFLDDALEDQDSGLHRDVTVVFRMANVLVTVELSQWSTDKSVEPPSEELQSGARQVAEELADQLDE